MRNNIFILFICSYLVTFKQISSIYFLDDVGQGLIVAVGEDDLGAEFEGGEVVDDEAAEEGGAVFEYIFVDNDFGACH